MKKVEKVEKAELVAPVNSVYTIECDDKKCFLREIDKKTFAQIFPIIAPFDDKEPDMLLAGEIVLRSCFVGGDTEFLSVDEYTIAASIQCASLIKIKTATIKKN